MKREFDANSYAWLVALRDTEFGYDNEPKKWKRLYQCNAYIYEAETGAIWLKSYETIVAVFIPNDNKLYCYGRYSNTTYKQVYKFRNWLWSNHHAKAERPWEVPYENIWYEDMYGEFADSNYYW